MKDKQWTYRVGIVIAAAVLVSACGGPKKATDVLAENAVKRTRGTLDDLNFALKNYAVECGALPQPVEYAGTKTDQRLEVKGKLLSALLGRRVDDMNKQEVAFMAPPTAGAGAAGLAGDQLVDAWGHPFIVWLDFSGDHKLANPDVTNADPAISKAAAATLDKDHLVISAGPDGVEGTADDIVSWRQ